MAALLSAVGAAAVAAFLLWPRSIGSDAEAFLEAALRYDARALLRYSLNHERQWAKLDESKLSTLLDEVIRPSLTGLSRVGDISAGAISEQEDKGTATAEFRDAEGRKYDITLSVYETDSHRKGLVLPLLIQAWEIEYERASGSRVEAPGIGAAEARVRGLERDIKLLKRLDIPGFVYEDPRRPVADWDERLAWWRNELERRKSNQQPDLTRSHRL